MKLFSKAFCVAGCAIFIAACGGGGSGDGGVGGGVGIGEVNLLGTWSATFTPDACIETVHLALATFVSNSGDTTELGPSRVELPTYGCPLTGIVTDQILRIEATGYPASMAKALFQELLTEHTSMAGTWTVVNFSSTYVAFHRDINSTGHNNGMYELTR